MSFAIRNEGESVILELEYDDTGGGILLKGVGKDGIEFEGPYILGISEDGKVHRCRGCTVPGVKLDENGAIEEGVLD